MKKLIPIIVAVTFVLLLLDTTFSFAQESHVAILLNNVNSRLNYGSMNSSLSEYKKDLRGIQAGLSWQAGVTKNFSLVTEAYFVKKGGTIKADNPLNGMKSTLRLQTIELPVLARMHVNRVYFNAGPYANYIFKGKWTEGETTNAISFSGPDGFRKWEAGFQAGGGFQFALKKMRMAIDVRYTHGVTSISKSGDLFNRTLNVNILGLRKIKQK